MEAARLHHNLICNKWASLWETEVKDPEVRKVPSSDEALDTQADAR